MTPKQIAALARLHESNKGRKASAETRAKQSEASKGKTKSAEHCLNISLAKTGKKTGPMPEAHKEAIAAGHRGKKRKPFTAEWKRKPGDVSRGKKRPHSEAHKQALKGIPKSAEHRRKLSDSKLGKPSWNKGKKFSEEVRKRMELAASTRKKPADASSLERFISYRLALHGGHRFEQQGQIPGLLEMSGRGHAFDFLLPDLRLAVELDGTYWHPERPERNFAADCNPEAFHELYATILGWRVVRIPEAVLRKSKPYRLWLRERNQEQKEIKRACKPPRIRINLASKSIASKAAHFERVKARSLATAA